MGRGSCIGAASRQFIWVCCDLFWARLSALCAFACLRRERRVKRAPPRLWAFIPRRQPCTRQVPQIPRRS